MFLILLLVCSDIPWQPPGFPELSEEFNAWQAYVPILRADEGYEQPAFWCVHNLGPFEDTSMLPYLLDIPYYTDTWSRGDTAFGQVNYYDVRLPDEGRPFSHNVVMVRWFEHAEFEPGFLVETYLLADPNMELAARYVAYERGDPCILDMNGHKVYRKKVRWWRCADDASFHVTGSVTCYLVITEELDFHITCFTTTFEYDDERLPLEIEGEVARPLVCFWPDPIAELERAVEQSFRVK